MARTGNRTPSEITESRPQTPAAAPSPSLAAGVAILSEWHFAQHVEELGGRAIAVGQVVEHAGPLQHAVCSRIEPQSFGGVSVAFVYPDATEVVWYFVGGYGR